MKNLILLIGFTYFDKYFFNPSEDVVRALDRTNIRGYRITAIILPVSFKRALNKLCKAIEDLKPRIALGVGLAPKINKPVIELVAVNVAHAEYGDVDGYKPFCEFLEPKAPFTVSTNLPYRKCLEKCKRRGLKLDVGVSIGTYLCNAVAYTLISKIKSYGGTAGFIHIPPHTDLAMRLRLPNYIPLHEIIETVRCILEITIEEIEDLNK